MPLDLEFLGRIFSLGFWSQRVDDGWAKCGKWNISESWTKIHGKGPVALIFSTQSRPEISYQVSAETLLGLRKKKAFTRVQWILNIFEPLLENFTAVRGGGLADYSRTANRPFVKVQTLHNPWSCLWRKKNVTLVRHLGQQGGEIALNVGGVVGNGHTEASLVVPGAGETEEVGTWDWFREIDDESIWWLFQENERFKCWMIGYVRFLSSTHDFVE